MKILFLTPKGSRKNLGGVEGHVRILREELEKRGHKVEELSLSEVGAPVVRLPLPWSPSTSRGVATTGFGRTGDFFRRKKSGPSEELSLDESINFSKLRAWEYLWKKRNLFRWADVIHVHDVFWWLLPYVLLNRLGLICGSFNLLNKVAERDTNDTNRHPNDTNKKSVFVTFHGWEGVCPPTRSAVWQKRLAQKLSQGTIGVGSFFEKWYGVTPNKVVYGALDSDCHVRQSRTRNDGLSVVFLGRLEEVNGIEILLGALDKYYKSYKSYKNRGIKIIFVGDGSYRKQAEKFGKVTGMVKNPQKYLVSADLVIASSYMSMLEAAAIGKPIIAVANNELKMDYLNCHPLRKYIKVARNADELYKGLTLDSQGETLKDLEVAQRWAEKQTPERLADEYEELWG